MDMLNKNKIIKILKYFCKNKKDIKLCYLFGSIVFNKMHKFSDIDIAILFHSKNENYYAKKILNYTAELILLFNFDKIDLICLNTAPPLLKFNVVKNSILIKCDSIKTHYSFKSKTLTEYSDYKYVLDFFNKK